MSQLSVRVGIVSFRCREPLLEVIRAIREQEPDWQIYVCDNKSDMSNRIREDLDLAQIVDWMHFQEDNLGFARALNQIAAAPGAWDVLVTINPDAEIASSLSPIVAACEVDGVAAAGGCITSPGEQQCINAYPDLGPIRLALRSVLGRRIEKITRQAIGLNINRIDGWIEGSALAFSRKAWDDLGPLDERFFLYSEEQDWQRRARLRGWMIVQIPSVAVIHHAQGTVADSLELKNLSTTLQESSRRMYIEKWWGRLGLLRYLILRRIALEFKSVYKFVVGQRR